MGTASLVIGLALIIFGFYFIYEFLNGVYYTDESMENALIGTFILAIPFIVGGALLLRKYDRDKKKEKN